MATSLVSDPRYSRRFTVLRAHGTCLIVEHPADGLPIVLHWGADLGGLEDTDLDQLSLAVSRQTSPGTLDTAWQLTIVPQESDGWGPVGPGLC